MKQILRQKLKQQKKKIPQTNWKSEQKGYTYMVYSGSWLIPPELVYQLFHYHSCPHTSKIYYLKDGIAVFYSFHCCHTLEQSVLAKEDFYAALSDKQYIYLDSKA